jgi:Uma2 family endonuclease
VREGSPEVSAVKVLGLQEVVLGPETALELWESGELHDRLNLPHDGTKVEIIDGNIVVTSSTDFAHSDIAGLLIERFAELRATVPEFTWYARPEPGLLHPDRAGGYVADLMVCEEPVIKGMRAARVRQVAPDEVEMVIEITSRGNASYDRGPKGDAPTKWRGYARMEIPYYLLIDRDTAKAEVTLYSIPDAKTEAYLHAESWKFGEVVALPEPFDAEIPTAEWYPWTPTRQR